MIFGSAPAMQFTALLGAALFRERLDAKKYAGLAIAAAALVLFAVS
jgi:drug/metabolite transporter (DMT)-like permease